MIISKMTPEELHGKRVSVYKNLHNGRWSVKHKGKVVAHLRELSLKPTKYHVNNNARLKVIEKKCRNVHAWINGEFVYAKKTDGAYDYPASYNPYKFAFFYRLTDLSEVTNLNCIITFRSNETMVIKEL
ncbi:hypothetical protein [Halobacteriovorax sp. ZH2_bin.1]|uniref:hypothetical protein n=1 Tax=Halobacteriovorax sp. ZH2_bin.1 TaxID=3157724 RepID=UPI00371C413E